MCAMYAICESVVSRKELCVVGVCCLVVGGAGWGGVSFLWKCETIKGIIIASWDGMCVWCVGWYVCVATQWWGWCQRWSRPFRWMSWGGDDCKAMGGTAIVTRGVWLTCCPGIRLLLREIVSRHSVAPRHTR